MAHETLIELDDRRRVSLGKIGRHSRYLVTEEPDGTIVLQPAVVITAAQADFDAMPDLQRRVDAFLDDTSTAVERPRPRRR